MNWGRVEINSHKIKSNIMADKKGNFPSPELNKMQEVVIDFRTKIYIKAGEDPEKAKQRYLNRLTARNA
jgi:hypothetical protein